MPLAAAAGAFLMSGTGAAVASGVIGAAGSMYAANQANKGVQRGIDAQTAAQDKALAQQQALADRTRQDQMPFMQTGYKALDALATQFGLNTPAPGSPGSPGSPDYDAYVSQYADVKAEGERVLAADPNAIGDLNQDGRIDLTDYGQYHAREFNDRTVPTVPQGETPQAGADATPSYGERPTYTRPTYGAAPSESSYFGKYEESPEYKAAVEQQMRDLNANKAASGLLKSGSLVTGALARASALQSADRNNWFGRQNTLYQSALQQYNINADRMSQDYTSDRAFGTGAFESDRGFDTGREDTRTDNLFRLASGGQSALSATQSAGTNAANQNGQTLANGANNLSALYGQQGANNGALAGALTGYANSALSAYGGGGSRYTPVPTASTADYGVTAANSNRFTPGALTQIPQVRF